MSTVVENPAADAEMLSRAASANDQFLDWVAYFAKERVHKVTGKLARSIHVNRSEQTAAGVEGSVEDGPGDRDRLYGEFEELGNQYHGPHAFLLPALEEAAPRAQVVAAYHFGVIGASDPGFAPESVWDE